MFGELELDLRELVFNTLDTKVHYVVQRYIKKSDKLIIAVISFTVILSNVVSLS